MRHDTTQLFIAKLYALDLQEACDANTALWQKVYGNRATDRARLNRVPDRSGH